MASITPRLKADGTAAYRVQFRVDGRMRQETFPHPEGAAEFGRLVDKVGGEAARRVLDARQGTSTGVPTLREFTAEYLDVDSGLLTGVEPGTRAGYVRIAERSFLPILGDMPVDAIEKQDVGRWVAWQEKQTTNPTHRAKEAKAPEARPLAAKTIRNYHALLSAILTAAVDAKHRGDNPAHRTRMTKGQRREGVFLSRSEFAQLLTHVPQPWQRFVLFLVGTGLRWGEATALTWADLNLDATLATVRVDKAWKKTEGGPAVLGIPKSSRSRRTVSLWPELVAALGPVGAQDALIFPAERGGKMWPGRFHDSIWKPALKRAREAGLTKSPNVHDLRHTHASWLIAGGAPLPYIQARLGHESITTTINTYGHLLPDAHVQMSAMIAETMADVLPPAAPLALEA